MNIRSKVAALFAAAIAISATGAFGQANVVETQGNSIVVDANVGSDSAVGTLSAPVKTLGSAVAKAMAASAHGVSTTINVNPGVYRESLDLSGSGSDAAAPITIQAASSGSTVLSGSDVVRGWAHSYGSVYVHSWSYGSTYCPVPNGWPSSKIGSMARRNAMIFVNGHSLTQVDSRSSLKPGTFYVDTGRRLAYVWAQSGANMGSATVEVAARSTVLNIGNRSNLVLRNLIFQHANSCMLGDAVNVYRSHNVLIDHVTAQWNNWGGISVSYSTNVTVQNSLAIHNGGIGFVSTRDKNILYQYDETDYNNWRGAMGNFYDWGMGGLKLLQTHGGTVRNLVSYHNQAQGLWFDTDNKNILIDNVKLIGNVWANLQLEANQGPITMQNSLVCNGGSGINFLTSEHVTVKNTKFYNNGGAQYAAQVYLGGRPGGRPINDWETGQYYHLYSQNDTFTGNVIEDGAGGQKVLGTYLSPGDWSHFTGSLHSDHNQWFDPTTSTAFTVTNARHVNLSGWRNSTGQDWSSAWRTYSVVKQSCDSVTPSAH